MGAGCGVVLSLRASGVGAARAALLVPRGQARGWGRDVGGFLGALGRGLGGGAIFGAGAGPPIDVGAAGIVDGLVDLGGRGLVLELGAGLAVRCWWGCPVVGLRGWRGGGPAEPEIGRLVLRGRGCLLASAEGEAAGRNLAAGVAGAHGVGLGLGGGGDGQRRALKGLLVGRGRCLSRARAEKRKPHDGDEEQGPHGRRVVVAAGVVVLIPLGGSVVRHFKKCACHCFPARPGHCVVASPSVVWSGSGSSVLEPYSCRLLSLAGVGPCSLGGRLSLQA